MANIKLATWTRVAYGIQYVQMGVMIAAMTRYGNVNAVNTASSAAIVIAGLR